MFEFHRRAAAVAKTPRLICKSEQLREGGEGILFEVADAGTMLPAFVVRYEGGVHGYLNRCAHVPVELDWQPGKFFDGAARYLICATHGATYEPDTGRCIAGPCAGQRLVALDVFEQDGNVWLREAA
jgi:nitrite reductase/ring-hydroxylating ferredoxin subunit